MSNVKMVKRWQTPDGTVFSSFQDATAHEKKTAISDRLHKAIYVDKTIPPLMSHQSEIYWIASNSEEIEKAITEGSSAS